MPQELGDFGVLIHSGWSKRKALVFNLISGLAFPLGGVLAYLASSELNLAFLVPFAAGNFIYIGASDLVPEVNKHHGAATDLLLFVSFAAGIAVLWGIRLVLES